MPLSLVSGKLAFLYDGYIAAIKNCCAPIAVKHAHIIPYVHSIISVRRFVQHDICYVRNVTVIRQLVQHEVVATELYT